MCLLFMACNKEDVSKVKLGKLSPFTVNFLRDMRDFLGVTFRLKPNDEDGTVDAACIGTGYTNTAKVSTPSSPPFTLLTLPYQRETVTAPFSF